MQNETTETALQKARELAEILEAGTQGHFKTAHFTNMSSGSQHVTVFLREDGESKKIVAKFPMIRESNRMTWDAKFFAECHNAFPSIHAELERLNEENEKLQKCLKVSGHTLCSNCDYPPES